MQHFADPSNWYNQFLADIGNVVAPIIHRVVAQALRNASPPPTAPDPEQLLKISEAADMLRISRATAFAWIAKGALLSVRLEGKVYIRKSDIMAVLKSQPVRGTQGRRTSPRRGRTDGNGNSKNPNL